MSSKLTFYIRSFNRDNFPVEVRVEEQIDENPSSRFRLRLDHGINFSYQEALDFAVKLAEVAIKGLADAHNDTLQGNLPNP